MAHCIAITPAGKLKVVPADSESASNDAFAEGLERAFADSSAAGLVFLARQHGRHDLPSDCAFWRGFAWLFFQAVRQLGEAGFGQWASLPPPREDALASIANSAPPMQGLEYLTVPHLEGLWTELRDHVAQQAAAHAGAHVGYLHDIHPLLHLVGRVTFHLAENKKSAERPFAFLATYTHKLSQQAKVQHLPLADALKIYAANKDLGKLDTLLEPVRRAAEKCELVRTLLESKALFAPQAWTIQQAYAFLKETAVMEEAGIVVRVPDWWSARKPPRPAVQVRLGAKQASAVGFDALLGFDIGLALEGETLSPEVVKSLLDKSAGLVLLRGKWVEVDHERLQEALDHWRVLEKQHAKGVSFIEGMRMLAGAELGGDTEDAGEVQSWSEVVAGPWLRETLARMRNPEADAACVPGRDLQATLRHYQVDGVRWLWFLSELGLGACLADDMGLGKTIQVIDVFLQRKRAGKTDKPNLLVVPASLLGNWRAELARFAPSLRVVFAHPSESSAERLTQMAKDPKRELAGVDVVITTYPLIRRAEWFQRAEWSLVVLDEAQAIKNAGSAQTRSVKKLRAASRVILTGTPVENHLGDLWSLFDFCCPGLLGNAAEFKNFVKRLRERQDAEAFAALRRLVRPYIMRRLKTDPSVAPDLPEKTEMRVECGLSKKQAVLYQKALVDFEERLENAEGIARRGLVLSLLMQLKQLCNHPSQFLTDGEFKPADSGKFERLRVVCEPIVARQEKALLFTQFQALTEPLAAFLATVFGRAGLVLHGGTPVKHRSELVKQFQSEDGPPFFVISLKAGGSGLNLTAASHVIHFDRWWNPAVENQATDRAFRIGQKRNVLVHKFVCRGTVEERIDEMIRAKQGVADQILQQDADVHLTELNDEELLRFVALDLSRAEEED